MLAEISMPRQSARKHNRPGQQSSTIDQQTVLATERLLRQRDYPQRKRIDAYACHVIRPVRCLYQHAGADR